MKPILAKLILAASVSALGMAGAASAQDMRDHHPARAEIHHRMHRQEMRIDRARAEGRISRHEAHALRHNLRDIRHEERADLRADHDGGHLTPGQAGAINHQLDNNSRKISG